RCHGTQRHRRRLAKPPRLRHGAVVAAHLGDGRGEWQSHRVRPDLSQDRGRPARSGRRRAAAAAAGHAVSRAAQALRPDEAAGGAGGMSRQQPPPSRPTATQRGSTTMIQDMSTVWLYAYSPNAGSPITAYHTVYTDDGSRNGRPI